ncbi:efflux RND transporter periplasmic adaptor subunit [Nevskia soli]|uniref:efflux RND transporter periplasmic adaptor subunit n=1 Tax=Nevskia soli TaxID=418856 RepID=UPI00068AB104|nr:efflux RND transporter periplasmic adaptor subunit [Nevskia soli]
MNLRLAAFVLLLTGAAGADDTPSVLVKTQAPQRGNLPETVTAYGTAVPAINGGMTLSVQAEGRVMHLMVTPGEAVHAGQALLEFQLSAAAGSTYEQAQSALKLARQEQARTARLLAQQLATRDQQAQADKAVGDAQAALTALEQENGGKPRQTITAPFDGVVGAIPVAQGERVQPGVALVTVTRAGGLVITVGIEPSQRRRLKLGQSATLVSLDAGLDAGSDGEAARHGKLVRIDKALNPKTRLVDADLVPDGDAEEPLQGQAFRADIEVGRVPGWLLPRNAVLDDEQGAYLFQVADGKAVRVNVKRVGGDDNTTVVDGPVDPARPLVTVGNYQLADGMAVRQDDAPATPANAPQGKPGA